MSCIKDLYFIDNHGYQINYTTFNLITMITDYIIKCKLIIILKRYSKFQINLFSS